MRFSFTLSTVVAALLIAASKTFASPLESVPTTGIEVFEYNIESQYSRFSVPLKAAQSSDLVFALQPTNSEPRADCHPAPDVLVVGSLANLCFQVAEAKDIGIETPARFLVARSDLSLRLADIANVVHDVNLTVHGYAEQNPSLVDGSSWRVAADHLDIRVSIQSVDDSAVPAGTGVLAHYSFGSLELLKPTPKGKVIDFSAFTESFTNVHMAPKEDKTGFVEDVSDIDEELATLRLLEEEAEALSAEISSRKQAIDRRIKHQTAKVPLSHLIEQCDGLVCAARAIAERICAKVSLSQGPPPSYESIHKQSQSILALSADATRPQQDARNSTKSSPPSYGTMSTTTHPTNSQPTALPSTNGTTEGGLTFTSNLPHQSTLAQALEAIAAILGLTALYTFIRRKCMSMRTRVERAADREERRNARAYRRAARRATCRRRWNAVIDSLNCFRIAEQPRSEDYEEKRALILQEAFLEQTIDQAEKGQVMEAEIRELRNAHSIVAGLVGARGTPYHSRAMNDPPPSLIPLPHSNAYVVRSRSSTATLPSYTSESLPDYTSTDYPSTYPSTDYSSPYPSSPEDSTTTDGFVNYTPTNSDEEGRYTPAVAPSSTGTTDGSSRTRYTPVSSVVGLSPRASEETLRTRNSKESGDSG